MQAVQQKASVRMKTPQGDMNLEAESVLVLPDRQRQVMRTPMGEMTRVVSPQGSYDSGPMGTHDMPASQKETALRELRTSPLAIAQRAEDPALVVRDAGSETIAEVEARILELSVEGHTDNVGDPKSNQTLSENRAKAVVAAVVAQGIEAERMSAVGRGQDKPVADNSTEEGRAKNRRVELVKKGGASP